MVLDISHNQLENGESLFTIGGIPHWYSYQRNPYLEFSTDLKHLPYESDIPFLGICLKNTKSNPTDTCSVIFLATLLIIARKWKQGKCPSLYVLIRRMLCIITMGQYSFLKKVKMTFQGNIWTRQIIY